MFYRVCEYLLIGPVPQLFIRPEIEGQENVPASGPAILASDHTHVYAASVKAAPAHDAASEAPVAA